MYYAFHEDLIHLSVKKFSLSHEGVIERSHKSCNEPHKSDSQVKTFRLYTLTVTWCNKYEHKCVPTKSPTQKSVEHTVK